MSGRKKGGADHRADTRGGALSGKPHAVHDSAAYLHLTPFERAVHDEILRRFNGYNNGEIAITYEEIGERVKGPNKCRPNNARIARAVATLMSHGLIAPPKPESWLERRAREYRLTYISSGKGPPYRPATNDYRSWTPEREKNGGDAPSPDRAACGDAPSPEAPSPDDPPSPAKSENGGFASLAEPVSGDAESLLIVKPYPCAENDALSAIRSTISEWWRTARPKERAALAKSHDLTVGELLAFIIGDGEIAFPKLVAVRASIAGPIGRAA